MIKKEEGIEKKEGTEKRVERDQTIELDCPPGGLRPGDLIGGVIEGTGLPKREDCSRFFGHWVWDYNDIPEDQWMEVNPIIEKRITALYNAGRIRYGSW